MAITQHKYIRIEAAKFGRKGLIYVAATLLVALFICVMAGLLGPDLLRVQSGGTEELLVDRFGQTELVLDVTGFNSMNQFYWINVDFFPQSGTRYEQINSVDIALNVTGEVPLVLFDGDHHIVRDRVFSRAVTCKGGNCDEFFLFGQRQIFFETLKLDLQFTDPDSTFVEGNKLVVSVDVVTISPEYTKFEMIWKDIFLVVTLFILFTKDYGYVWKLQTVPARQWSSHQIWVLLLLCGLVMFNDPFFSLQIFTRFALQFSDFYIIMTVSFVCLLMMFWLCSFDELRLDEGGARDGRNPYATRRSMIKFFGPKSALMLSLWSVLVWLYLYLNRKRDEDPTYDGDDDDVLWNGTTTVTVLVTVYALYLFGLIVLNIDKIRAFSPPFMFLFILTMITVTFTLVALASGYFFPFNVPALLFVLFYAVINLYIWAMAFSYCPFSDSDSFKYQLGPSAAFGEDYFDDVSPPSISSRQKISNDNIPLIGDREGSSALAGSGDPVGGGQDSGFRHRLSFGSTGSDSRAHEKNANRLELATLGSRSGSSVVAAAPQGASTLSVSSAGLEESVDASQPRAQRQATRLGDFQSVEFT